MDIFSFFSKDWAQDEVIDQLRDSLVTTRQRTSASFAAQNELLRLLQQQNDELRLRLGVLIRLLVEQGALSPELFASAVDEAKAAIVAARAAAPPKPAAPLVAQPARKLPKPPKLNVPKGN